MRQFKNFFISVILSFFTMAILNAQNLETYKIFTGEGKNSNWEKLVEKASNSDVVYFGELHNDPIGHWLQFQLAKSLYAKSKNKLVIGAEMFEHDNQRTLDEYLSGLISTKNYESEMRLWPNYKTDYKPIVDWAKTNNVNIVASNIPRRYANLVFREGFEGLSKLGEEAKKDIAPIPIEYDASLPGYKNMLGDMDPGHTNENLPKAQAIKDATMAYFISKNVIPDGIFLHLNGAYHSDNHEGILWYLKKLNGSLKQFTISTVSQDSLDNLEDEYKNKADFIIVVPTDFTKTH